MRARETHIAESSLDHEQKAAEDTAEREKNMLFRRFMLTSANPSIERGKTQKK